MSAGARRWLLQHPSVPAGKIDRLRRLVEPDARDAFAVLTMVAMRARLGVLGGVENGLMPTVRLAFLTWDRQRQCVPRVTQLTWSARSVKAKAGHGSLDVQSMKPGWGAKMFWRSTGTTTRLAPISNADHHCKSTSTTLSQAWTGSSTPKS